MRHKKPLPVFLVILLDLLGVAAMLGVFALFHFGLRSESSQALMDITAPATAAAGETSDALPEETPAASAGVQDVPPTPEPTPTPTPGDFSATFPTGSIDEPDALGSYADEQLRIVVSEKHTEDATYFVADVWVRNITGFRTAFAGNKFNGGYAMPDDMAGKHNAILALSGDCYKARPEGIVIRNGTLYRDSLSGDVCILYVDGVMESYYESSFDLDTAIARGAYQGWCFGPKLIDNGQVPSNYNTSDKIVSHNPRAAIGYFAPGHYCLVYVDGRNSDNSAGLTLNELSQVMIDLGCKDAYNLDGGQSSMMIFQGQVVGSPYKGGRDISDIIYFGGDDPQ